LDTLKGRGATRETSRRRKGRPSLSGGVTRGRASH
jgi:hypothetical protein